MVSAKVVHEEIGPFVAFARNKPEAVVIAPVAEVYACVQEGVNGIRGDSKPLRFRHEVGGATIHASSDTAEWLGTELLGDGFLRCIHIQDRPIFLKALNDVDHEGVPVFAHMRIHTVKDILLAEASFWPETRQIVKSAIIFREVRLPRSHGSRSRTFGTAVSDEGNRLRLFGVAQGELLDIASSFSLLCRSSLEGREYDLPGLRTVRHLSERLEAVGNLLSALDDKQQFPSSEAHSSFLDVIQAAVSRHGKKASDRNLTISVDVAGAVREPVAGLVAHLLEIFVSSALQMVSFSGTIDIATRREGRAVALSAVLSSVHYVNDVGAESDLAIIRYLAIQRGGQFSVSHRFAPSQQWILRLPLGIESNSAKEGAGTTQPAASRHHGGNVIFTKQDKSVA